MNHLHTLAACAVAGLLAAGSAAAQTGDQPGPQGTYQLGSALSVTPAMVIVAGRDSNAIRTSTGREASEVYVVPQIEGWLGRGRLRLNFANAVEFSKQQAADTNLTAGTTNQYHVARLEAGTSRLGMLAVAGFRDHYAPPTDFVGFELGLKSRRIEREFGNTVTLRPGGRLIFRGNVNLAQIRYDADARFEGSSLRQNLNRNTLSYGGEVNIALSPLSSIGASANYYQDRFVFAPDRDGNGTRLSVGAQFSPRALIAGRADAGYISYRPLRTNASYGGPAYNVGLTLTKSPFLVDVSGRRSIEYSFDPGRGFYLSNGIDVLTVVSLRRWELFGRGTLRGMAPKGLLAELEPFRALTTYKVGLVRRLGQAMRLGADVERYKTGGPGGFDGVRTTFFMIYGSTRLQRLDRPLPGGF